MQLLESSGNLCAIKGMIENPPVLYLTLTTQSFRNLQYFNSPPVSLTLRWLHGWAQNWAKTYGCSKKWWPHGRVEIALQELGGQKKMIRGTSGYKWQYRPQWWCRMVTNDKTQRDATAQTKLLQSTSRMYMCLAMEVVAWWVLCLVTGTTY